MNLHGRFRATVVTTLLCAIAPVTAQQPMPPDMAQVMQHAQALQACLAKVDQGALDELRGRGQALGAEVKALCAAGKRDEAQAHAITAGRAIAESPAMRALGDCGEMARGMVQHPAVTEAVEGRASHVCDSAM
ncbi:MAG: hypothetical protein AB7O21_18895 [Gammaproteobacteria bacterium]